MTDYNPTIGPFGLTKNQSLTIGPFGFLESDTAGGNQQENGSGDQPAQDLSVFLGSTQMNQVFVGSVEVTEIYYGSIQVWAKQEVVEYTPGLTYTWYNIPTGHPQNESEMDAIFNDSTSGVSLGGTGDFSGEINWADGSQNGAGGSTGSKPSYLPASYYSWQVEGYIEVPETGTYTFGVDGDDAIDMFVNDQRVADYYDGHGFEGDWDRDFGQNTGTISLTAGQYYTFKLRMEENSGGDGVQAGWQKPSDSSISIIPGSAFYKTAGSGTSIVTNNLILHLDAGNSSSYSGSGNTWFDISGNNNDATISGTNRYTSADGGKFDYRLSTTDHIILPSQPLQNTTGEYTIVFWMQPEINGTRYFHSVARSGNDNIQIMQLDSSGIRSYNGGSYLPITNNEIMQLSLVRDSSGNGTMYKNGSNSPTSGTLVDISGVDSGGWILNQEQDSVGGGFSTSQNVYASFMAVYVYDRALSTSELDQNFNAIKDRFGL